MMRFVRIDTKGRDVRIFVAAEMSETLRFALVDTQAALRSSVRGRYVAPDALHLTLAFIGELRVEDLPLVSEAVRSAVRGFDLVGVTLGGLGSFGARRKATLWQSVEGEGVIRLAGAVRTALVEVGVGFDTTPFLAHVTLMRGADLKEGVLPPPIRASSSLEAVCVWRSRLDSAGASYEVLDRIGLGVETGADTPCPAWPTSEE